MPKFSLATALSLYEEDCSIRVSVSSIPQTSCNENYSRTIFTAEEEGIVKNWLESISEDSEDSYTDIIYTKSSNIRRKRRIANSKAKKKLIRNAKIADANYCKRVSDIMHVTSKNKDEFNITKRNHPVVRANRLIKKANKIG